MFNEGYWSNFYRTYKNILVQIIVVMIVFVVFQVSYYKYQVEKIEREIKLVGKSLSKELEKDINIKTSVLISFGYNYYLDNNMTKEKFNYLSKHFIEKYPNILYFQHKNKETITEKVYPLEGNEGTLGKSLRNSPRAAKSLERAIDTRMISASAPHELKLSNYKTIGLTIYYPIFKNNEFDGFFASVIDLNKFFSYKINQDIRDKYYVSIMDSSGREFYSIGERNLGYTYEDRIDIEDNYLTIVLGLQSNYKARLIFFIFLISLIAGCLFIILFYLELKIFTKDRSISDLILLKDRLRKEIENRKVIESDLSKLAAIIKTSEDAIIRLDLRGNVITWNAGAEKIYGFKEKEIVPKNISSIIPKNKLDEMYEALEKVTVGETLDYFETERVTKNGEEIFVSTTISPIRDKNENIIGFSEISKDITEHKLMEQSLHDSYDELSAVYQQLAAAEEELRSQFEELQKNEELLRQSEQRHELIISASLDGIYDWDIESGEMYHSSSWKKMMDFEVDEIQDSYEIWESFIHPNDKKMVIKALEKYLKRESENFIIEYRFKKKDGAYIWVHDRGVAVWDEYDRPIRMAGTLKNIDDRKKREKDIYNMAYYDPLTNLPNRILFEEELNKALSTASLDLKKGAVFFIDLDNFKNINDTLGHELGDKLIVKVGKKLQKCVGEHGIVTRFGGDEFLVMQSPIANFGDPTNLAENMLDIFKNPWEIGEHKIYITASIGIAIFPNDGVDVSEILKNADTAMYKAKGEGKNKYQFFHKLMSDEIIRKTKIGNALRNALRNNEFELHYQPVIELKTGKIVSFEALLRWIHPEWGNVPPNEFIPIAEETGLIISVGEWVLKSACKQNKEWKDKGYKYNSIAVNVSSVQLQQSNFLQSIKSILKECDLAPEFLEIEITESVLMKYIDWNIQTLSSLQNMGIKIAIDDFGTGYSSLNYLKSLPINSVKIDKSFIDGISINSNEESILEGIILLAHKMKLDVVAEGVEEKEQIEILEEKNCDKIQGYYINRPYPPDELEKFVKIGYYDLSKTKGEY